MICKQSCGKDWNRKNSLFSVRKKAVGLRAGVRRQAGQELGGAGWRGKIVHGEIVLGQNDRRQTKEEEPRSMHRRRLEDNCGSGRGRGNVKPRPPPPPPSPSPPGPAAFQTLSSPQDFPPPWRRRRRRSTQSQGGAWLPAASRAPRPSGTPFGSSC